MPPASSRNIGVARFDASSRASINGKLFGEPGVPSGSLTATPGQSVHAHAEHRCRSRAALPRTHDEPRRETSHQAFRRIASVGVLTARVSAKMPFLLVR